MQVVPDVVVAMHSREKRREKRVRCVFRVEKTNYFFRSVSKPHVMLRALKALFYRPTIRMGMVDCGAMQPTRLRNAGFVSFMAESIHPFQSDRFDARLRRRKRMKAAFVLGIAAGVAWVVLESAHALSMF
jgi:hypothetical protein